MAGASLIFRRPLPSEAEAFAALHVQCWQESYTEIVPKELMATFTSTTRLPMWQSAIPNLERFVLGAYVENQPAGFVISGSTPEKHVENQDGHLWAIYILEAYQGKGIGRNLVRYAHADWAARGGTSMTVGVLAENKAARLFYEKLGARFVRDGEYEWSGHRLKDCIYIWNDLNTGYNFKTAELPNSSSGHRFK